MRSAPCPLGERVHSILCDRGDAAHGQTAADWHARRPRMHTPIECMVKSTMPHRCYTGFVQWKRRAWLRAQQEYLAATAPLVAAHAEQAAVRHRAETGPSMRMQRCLTHGTLGTCKKFTAREIVQCPCYAAPAQARRPAPQHTSKSACRLAHTLSQEPVQGGAPATSLANYPGQERT